MQMKMVMIAAGLLLSGCAGLVGAEAPAGPVEALELQRGRAIAELRCSSCHSVTAHAERSAASAPAFASLSRRHTGLALERRLAVISREGHFEMPRLQLQSDEIAALARYMESLDGP